MSKDYAEIPEWVKTSPEEIAMDVKELTNIFKGKDAFVLINDHHHACFDMIACSNLRDMAFYITYFNVLGKDTQYWGDRTIFRGKVQDPEDLPFELSIAEEALVIYDDWTFEVFETMTAATDFIEERIQWTDEDDLGKFAVIIGKEVTEIHKGSLRRMIRMTKSSAEECKKCAGPFTQ